MDCLVTISAVMGLEEKSFCALAQFVVACQKLDPSLHHHDAVMTTLWLGVSPHMLCFVINCSAWGCLRRIQNLRTFGRLFMLIDSYGPERGGGLEFYDLLWSPYESESRGDVCGPDCLAGRCVSCQVSWSGDSNPEDSNATNVRTLASRAALRVCQFGLE